MRHSTPLSASATPHPPSSPPSPHTPQVLGLSPGAGPDAVNRAYNRLKRERRGDDAFIARLEAAHGSLMMAQLTARVKGGFKADPSVAYADRGTFFPWRPRRADADKSMMLYAGAIQAALAVSAFLSPTASTQPVVASAVVGAIANILKLNKIFPPSNSEDASPQARSRGAKNMGRGLLLAVMATFAGCFLIFTLPDLVSSLVRVTLPPAFYEGESLLLAVGAAVANWVFTSFYR